MYSYYVYRHILIHLGMEKSHSGRPRTGGFPTFENWQVVNPSLLRLLSTNLLVYYRLALNYNMKGVQNIVPYYQLFLLLYSFDVWNINLHFTTRVFGQSAISPFLGGDIPSHSLAQPSHIPSHSHSIPFSAPFSPMHRWRYQQEPFRVTKEALAQHEKARATRTRELGYLTPSCSRVQLHLAPT